MIWSRWNRRVSRALRLPLADRLLLGEATTCLAGARLAVSLLPWQFHPQVARACLNVGKHMVTTSYVKEEMSALDAEAREKGVILFNELGVDPGIDHMTAMQVIDRVHADGGEVTTFQSYCGGLPAPEANDNPYGYKFSWSPRAVVVAGRNSARYRKDGEVVWGRLHVAAVRDEQAQPKYSVVVCEDVTKRRRVEQQLRDAHVVF